MRHAAQFRFYAELNDCLASGHRFRTIGYVFRGNPAVKDCIEALGVPHTEVDLILVNGEPAPFNRPLLHNDRVAVYPVFETLDISPIGQLRKQPLRDPRFIADVHLGKLARRLRMIGFDTLYRNNYSDPEIIYHSLRERRIILTRDRGILKHASIQHGYWVRSLRCEDQLIEVVRRFDLKSRIMPFHRCTMCNCEIEAVPRAAVLDRLLPGTRHHYQEFFQCNGCQRIYWKGSHFERMKTIIRRLRQNV